MCMRVRVCVCLRKSWLKSSVLEGLVVLVHCHIMAKKESACESASVRRGKEAPKDGCNVAAKEQEDEDEDEEEGHC